MSFLSFSFSLLDYSRLFMLKNFEISETISFGSQFTSTVISITLRYIKTPFLLVLAHKCIEDSNFRSNSISSRRETEKKTGKKETGRRRYRDEAEKILIMRKRGKITIHGGALQSASA